MNINYTLVGINVVQLYINLPVIDKAAPSDTVGPTLNIGNTVLEIVPDGILKIMTEIKVSQPEATAVIFSIRVVTDFNIENKDEVMNSTGDLLPKDFIDVILGICYSTIRGIVYEKTVAYNGGLLIPIINPQELTRDHKRVKSSDLQN